MEAVLRPSAQIMKFIFSICTAALFKMEGIVYVDDE